MRLVAGGWGAHRSAVLAARVLHRHKTASGRSIAFSTGLSYRAPNGMPDVMRSEETQVFGSLDLGVAPLGGLRAVLRLPPPGKAG